MKYNPVINDPRSGEISRNIDSLHKSKIITPAKVIITCSLLLFVLIFVGILSLTIGANHIGISDILNIILNRNNSEIVERTILDIRLPRILLAILVGASLSFSGTVFQSILRNPLAEPYILGISGGAAVGTLISILIGFNLWYIGTPVMAFSGSIFVVIIVYLLASRYGMIDTNLLLLSGVMIGAFLSAIILFLVTMMGQPVRNALLWLLGSLSNADLISISVVSPIIIFSSIGLYFYAHKLNLIAMGDEMALQLGVNVGRVKKISYILASIITGSAVSLSGTIGFIGLIIPHICRILFGPDNRILLPTSFIIGSIFLLIVDILARTLLYPIELPVGALTAAIGAPAFIFLLKKSRS